MTPTQPLDAMRSGFTKIYEGLAEVLAAVRQCEEATLDWSESAVGDADIAHLSGPRVEDPPTPEATETPTKDEDQDKADTPAPTVDLETVRKELNRLVKSGYRDLVKQLITSHGGTKLPNVPEENYTALLEEAKKVV